MSKVFRSWRSFWNFHHSVSREFRYIRSPENEEFIDTVRETCQARKVSLDENTILWRAQLGHEWREQRQDEAVFEIPCPYPPDRMKPQSDKASDGRANPKGIPCLYLATHLETAICEIRPWIGSYVSVAQFKILRTLKLVDCSIGYNKHPVFLEEPEPEKRNNAVWSHIDRAFAEPMTRSDDTADYATTQILAEVFRSEGFDGVAYKSNFGEGGHNVALFSLTDAEWINCGLHKVDKIDVKFSEQDLRISTQNTTKIVSRAARVRGECGAGLTGPGCGAHPAKEAG